MWAQLEKAGLTVNESKVFLCLIESGSSPVSRITKRCGLHRRNVYDAIERLTEKGLVSSVSFNNVSFFEAVHPKRLLEIIDEKHRAIEEVIPSLMGRFMQNASQSEVRVFQGNEGIKHLLNDLLDTLDEGGDYFLLGGTNLPAVLGPFVDQFHKRRIKKKITANDIFIDLERAKVVAKMPFTKVRILPQGIHPNTQITVYNDKVHIFSTEKIAVQIHHKDIASSLRTYWGLMWNLAADPKLMKIKKD